MALHTLNTLTAANLVAVQFTANMSDSDIAGLSGLIVSDIAIKNNAVVATGVISSGNSKVTSLVVVTSGSNIPITAIQPGHWAFGPNIPAGTQVLSISGTTVTLTASASADAASGSVVYFLGALLTPGAFSRYGQLWIPNRGWHKVFPGDFIAVDSTGWPIHLSQQSISSAVTSSWVFV